MYSYKNFERKMIQFLHSKQYEPDSQMTLLQAFRAIGNLYSYYL